MKTTSLSENTPSLQMITEPASIAEMGRLLDQVFPVEKTGSYFDDFPVWTMPWPERMIRLGVYKEGRMVSCAAGRICETRTPRGGLVSVGLIGAVATDPMARNQGYASQAVQAVADWLASRGVAAMFLWGSEHTMYHRLGFELCGSQVRVPFRDLGLMPSSKNGEWKVQSGWHPGIFQLQMRRPQGLAIRPPDLQWMSLHKNVEWRYVESAQGRVIAYLGYGRGMDLQGMVHEWGGEPKALQGLWMDFLSSFPNAELLCNEGLLKDLGIQYPTLPLEYLCLGKVVQPELILNAFSRAHQGRLRPAEGGWEVTLLHQPTHLLSSRELSKLFFGPERFAEYGDTWEPLPLWFWGLDAC